MPFRFKMWIRKFLHRRAGSTDPHGATERIADGEWEVRVRAAIEGIEDPVTVMIARSWIFERKSLRTIGREVGLSIDEVRRRFQTAMRRVDREQWPLPAVSPGGIDPDLFYWVETFDSDHEERIEEITESFWDLLHKGEEPDPRGFLGKHPDLAERLRGRLWLIQLMHQARHREDIGPYSGQVRELDGPEFESLFRRALESDQDMAGRLLRMIEERGAGPETISEAEARALIWKSLRQSAQRWESTGEWWRGEVTNEEPGPIQRALEKHPNPVDAEILQQHLSDGQTLERIANRLKMDAKETRLRYRRARHWLHMKLDETL